MSVRAISIREVEGYLQRPGTRLVDLRSREEYDQYHLEGAMNVPYEENFQPEGRLEHGYRYSVLRAGRRQPEGSAADERKRL